MRATDIKPPVTWCIRFPNMAAAELPGLLAGRNTPPPLNLVPK